MCVILPPVLVCTARSFDFLPVGCTIYERLLGGPAHYRVGCEEKEVEAPPKSKGMQPVPCSQSLAGCGSAQEMANPIEAPNYNSGVGMTYMSSTQSGVSATDQALAIGNEFFKDEP